MRCDRDYCDAYREARDCRCGLLEKHRDECGYWISLKEKQAHSSISSSAGLEGPLDTGDLVNDPLYIALDKLYERGWTDKHQEVDYDPRGTTQWQDVLDLFRSQKAA